MSGIKCFILGFCLSVSGIALYAQLQNSPTTKKKDIPAPYISIDLFKLSDTQIKSVSLDTLFTPIQKQSLEIKEAESTQDIADVSLDNSLSADGIEDDEILSINMDADIPIEFSAATADEPQAEVILNDDEKKLAMLPEDLIEPTAETTDDSPWAVAKVHSNNTKNKNLLEKFEDTPEDNLFTETISQTAQNDDNVSYKVAEKIKQSIIFPIPNEILNDENLTPTFINKNTSTPKPAVESKVQTPTVRVIEPKQSPDSITKKETDKSILTSISTWFSEPPTPQKPSPLSQKKAPPAYSSEQINTSVNSDKKVVTNSEPADLASFYESLQQTKKEHTQRKILPSELKLSFQPGRAEISGSTLQWLKIFSEATFNENTYLQVRLDASASNELQKRRLNLLYTIFMNNGVDFNKIDTVFSKTEPNAFIIRTMRYK